VLLPKLKAHCSGTNTNNITNSLAILTAIHKYGYSGTKAAVKGCLDAAVLQGLADDDDEGVAQAATLLQEKLASR
jgi:hypothetical protein